MRKSPIRLAIGILVFAMALTLLAGCEDDGPEVVTSAWPVALSERTVERPAEIIRWPLTGLPATDPSEIDARAISIKVENSSTARPQSNLQDADIVYETLTEGSITRFNAIFHSQTPEVVGPVRSARLSDVYIVPQYDAFFAHVGGNDQVLAAVRGADIDDLDEFANSGPYWRSSDRPSPHNMYAHIGEIRDLGITKGFDAEAMLQSWAFDLFSQPASPTVVEVTIPFGSGNDVVWTYDETSNRYLRSQQGSVQTDKVTGEQLSTRNMLVLWAQTSFVSKRDVAGSLTRDIVLDGSGRATLFRDGDRFDATWHSRDDGPPELKADDGTLVKLVPGNTWIEVISTDMNIAMK